MFKIFLDEHTVLTILAGFIVNIFLFIRFRQMNMKSDRFSHNIKYTFLLLGILTIFFYIIAIWLYSDYTNGNLDYEFRFITGVFFWLPVFITLLIVAITTLILKIAGKWESLVNYQNNLRENARSRPNSHAKIDFERKMMHILLFFLLFLFFFLSSYFTYKIVPDTRNDPYKFWEITPSILIFPDVITGKARFSDFGLMHQELFITFFVTYTISAVLEMTRNSPNYYVFTNNFSIKLARKKEVDTLMSYFPFFAGITLVTLIFPPIPAFAIISISVFGDMAASQIGIRWGKHKISWNLDKSWEGAIGGFVGSLIAIWIVGPVWGLTGAIIFLIVDLITEKPVSISDNILFPLCGTIGFLLLYFLHISYNIPIIVDWFIF